MFFYEMKLIGPDLNIPPMKYVAKAVIINILWRNENTGEMTISDVKQKKCRSPFGPDEVLSENLRKKLGASAENFGSDQSSLGWFMKNGPLFEKTGSCWEAALALDFFIWCYKQNCEKGEKCKSEVEKFCLDNLNWLLDKIKYNPFMENDFAIWDTSIVISSMVRVIDSFEWDKIEKTIEKEKAEVMTRLEASIKWLKDKGEEISSSGAELSQISISDVSQIAITFICLMESKKLKDNQTVKTLGGCLDDLIEHLLISVDVEKSNKGYYWSDYNSTADALEALASYNEYSSNVLNVNGNNEKTYEIGKYIKSACEYLEASEDCTGNWGGSYDTLRCLYSYLLADSCLRKSKKCKTAVKADVGVVFRVLRWINDEKRAFDDGSYLHTTFLTTFYVNAVTKSIEWLEDEALKLERYTSYDLYDYVLRLDRKDEERRKIHRLELELDRAKYKNQFLRHFTILVILSAAAAIVLISYFWLDDVLGSAASSASIIVSIVLIVIGIVQILPNVKRFGNRRN
ncbi:MAG: hypothetical protein FWG96_01035 [Methanomassiliicoccaceae archaeon]|nr:hypothetical protein [Methanomassiliicoccaceae archaeon]